PSELGNKKIIRRKIIASKVIEKGDILDDNNLDFKRSEKGLDAKYYELVSGRKTKNNIKANEIIYWGDLE
ncbi:MAG: SAF domain-containing protein, partial [Methanosarcinaceae archaeon]|nr:SAF domain-containing protein [Methanosarcinaceae archaeon]